MLRFVLLALALAASLHAGLRVARRAGAPLGVLATALAGAAFVAGACAPWSPMARWFVLVYALGAWVKALALGRDGGASGARAAAFLLAYPGLEAAWAFVRDRRPRRRAGLRQAVIGLVETAAAPAVATLLDRVGVHGWGLFPAAWARGVVLTLLLDGGFRLLFGLFRASGFRAEDVFREPWRASDLGDFWGRRWNRGIGRTLEREVYVPLRPRAGRPVAALAAFGASGVLHEVLMGLTGGRPGPYLAFFLLQGVALAALRGVRSARLRFAVSWAVLLGTAPLFFGEAYRRALPLERTFG
jgi:alginate O-acetyltransferase complex protein AlgI